MTPVLEFRNVTKNYHTHRVLDQLSFAIQPGKIVGLLGPNGCGKSTTIKLAAGLLQPTSGQVLVDGQQPGLYSKSVLSYLPERSYLNNWMRIRQLLDFFGDFYQDFDRQRAAEMLEELGIDQNVCLRTLSKGNKEKVQLVLVMSRRAKLYILDEPIGGVDPAARDYILRTILSSYAEDSSILITTHLIQDVEAIFDDVLFLSNGRILLGGPVDQVRDENQKSIDQLFREVFKC